MVKTRGITSFSPSFAFPAGKENRLLYLSPIRRGVKKKPGSARKRNLTRPKADDSLKMKAFAGKGR
jgi:hypothetical protein